MVEDSFFSHKQNYVTILNLEKHPNCITGSKVRAVLLNGLILPTGRVASGRLVSRGFVFRTPLETKVTHMVSHS